MANPEPTLLYFNVSGFGVVYTLAGGHINIGEVMGTVADEWKYIMVTRRVVSYPMVLKILTDQCGKGICFSRLYFYEIRHKPISMLYQTLDAKTIHLIDSRPEPLSLLRRIAANPRYSNTIILLAKTNISNANIPMEWIHRMARTARKLYLELSPIIYGKEMGRLIALQLQEQGEVINIKICVSREGVSSFYQYGDLRIEIIGIDRCFS